MRGHYGQVYVHLDCDPVLVARLVQELQFGIIGIESSIQLGRREHNAWIVFRQPGQHKLYAQMYRDRKYGEAVYIEKRSRAEAEAIFGKKAS